MGRLILVRHGESELNRDGIFYGQLDPELTEKGVRQAKEAKEILRAFHYDEIYVSDLVRARDTARILNHRELEVIETERLRELNFGIFEGLKYEEILEKYPEEEALWREKWQDYDYESGESVRELQRRSVEFIEEKLEEEKDILVVAHWGVINCVLSHYLTGGLEGYWKFATDNCGIAVINFRDKFPVLEGLNIGGKKL
ncbi:alpha-ribazole-5'-phosphate phosphatase [Propionigenium maris DSM 9537]|uniref:Alpha-ribazole-5'-phosphate phosphatase n=1 Tax=Propionigenium maris DSM 9537 TaxID=1123000 RepID=A0A9W6GL51_9FUSO|nr:histidine phosphatase family protein [Propionigenium maris]GLI56170.1 alpha-ribazole-5'-phosphate phosphatase [Propionigenium maris DSM 9537]